MSDTPLSLHQIAAQLERQAQNAALAGGDTVVKVKDPYFLVLSLQTIRLDLVNHLRAGIHALRSYEHGNASPELAKQTADFLQAFYEKQVGMEFRP